MPVGRERVRKRKVMLASADRLSTAATEIFLFEFATRIGPLNPCKDCDSGKTLSQLVGDRMRRFPASGEINTHLQGEARAVLERAQKVYAPAALNVDFTDGLSVEYREWRFNLRGSNTEPLVRLNVESRGSTALMQEKTQELLRLIRG